MSGTELMFWVFSIWGGLVWGVARGGLQWLSDAGVSALYVVIGTITLRS